MENDKTKEIKYILQEYEQINTIIWETLINCELSIIKTNNQHKKIEFQNIRNELIKVSRETKESVLKLLHEHQ